MKWFIKKQKALVGVFLFFFLALPFGVVLAEDTYDPMVKLNTLADNLGLKTTDFPTAIGSLINIVLSFLGIIFFVLIVYAGITWMTSGGNEQKIAKAKETIVSATVGLAIVMLSYALSVYIMSKLASVGIIS